MARTSSSDTSKPPATAAAETAAAPQSPTETTDVPIAAAGTQTGPVQPTNPANAIGSTVQAGQTSADTAVTTTDAKPGTADQVQVDVDSADKGEITIYPLRSYLDGKEVRRAGGAGYKSPKHDAVSLIAAGLATDKKPKA